MEEGTKVILKDARAGYMGLNGKIGEIGTVVNKNRITNGLSQGSDLIAVEFDFDGKTYVWGVWKQSLQLAKNYISKHNLKDHTREEVIELLVNLVNDMASESNEYEVTGTMIGYYKTISLLTHIEKVKTKIGMKKRSDLINKFQRWLDTDPRKELIAIECANIAEAYLKENLK